jgi:hypothetical protein
VYALVTTGRTGSDFLQSLLDSHPEVLTFNGHLLVYTEFLQSSVCFAATPRSAADLVDEFIGRFIHKLVSRYDVQEGKDRLGADGHSSFTLDTAEFRSHVLGLMGAEPVTSRDFLLALYGAYNLCLRRDLLAGRIVFHHPHLIHELDAFLHDFPTASVVVTTRDPRASFASHVEHFRRYYPHTHDNEHHLYVCLKMMLEDSTPIAERGLRYVAVRLEDLPHESTMHALSDWLGITYADCLLRSTWAGLEWHGDRLSARTFPSEGWSASRTENGWEQRLGWIEKYVLNYIMQSRLEHYRYRRTPVRPWDAIIVALLILLPMRYERRYFSAAYNRQIMARGLGPFATWTVVNAAFYCRRVALCYRHYFKAVRGARFSGAWIPPSRAA